MCDYSDLLKARKSLWLSPSRAQVSIARDEIAKLKSINQKIAAYEFVRSQEVECVEHRMYPNIRLVPAENLAPDFVIKPANGHSSAGVFVLSALPTGAYRCHMTEQIFASFAEVVSAFESEFARKPHSIRGCEVLVEELVRDSQGFAVPLDYKVYSFLTGAPIVMQRYAPRYLPKSKWAFAFYDEQGNDLGPIRASTARNPQITLNPPHNLDEMFWISRKLVQAAHVSFMRVDLYSTKAGIKFGEFTAIPNAAKEYFVDDYERILGNYWSDSLKILGISYS